MRRCPGVLVAAVVTGAVCVALLPGAVAAARNQGVAVGAGGGGGTWGKARVVPGLAALNAGGAAQVRSVSCAAPGECSAGGYYVDGAARRQAFVVSEKRGIWGHAEKVLTATLNAGGNAQVEAVSCAAPGDCSAGGWYVNSSGQEQAFVVGETNGAWGHAEEVPGIAALNTGGGAETVSVSCASTGNCGAGGRYINSSGFQAFVVSETNGIWGHAEEVPGIAALNTGGGAETASVSCAAQGNCSAGGDYEGRFNEQAFVVSETNGIWGTAKKAPGTAALNKRDAEIGSVSCASPGNCAAGGFYTDRSGHYEVLVIGEQHGIWGRAEEAPGTAALNKGAVAAGVNSMSCASPGDCSAGGTYTVGMPASYAIEALVIGEKHGAWVTAEEAPGTGALNNGGDAQIFSVSCASPGNCSAGGQYANSSGFQAFVVSEAHGIWGRAEEVPGTAALNLGADAGITSVACASAGNCAAGGYYTARSGNEQAILVTQTNHS